MRSFIRAFFEMFTFGMILGMAVLAAYALRITYF